MRSRALVLNEVIKARSRLALWLALLGFTALMTMILGGMYYDGLRNPVRAMRFPDAWGMIVTGPGTLAAFFASMVLILLVGSEFTWRTARQNVIDGLSKEEFFAAKLLLMPSLALLFFATLLVIGGVFAFAAKDVAGTTGPLIRGADAALMGGALLGILGWGALAFFLAMTIRSSGSAMGAFFLYFLVEQVAGGVIASLGDTGVKVARYLPTAIFRALWDPARYGATPVMPGRDPTIATPVLIAAGVGFVTLFVALAFLAYRRRDL